jgi:carbamoyltransferase
MIKGRDFWMPFAPSVLYEDLDKYFIIEKSVVDWEYMIFTAESLLEKRAYAKSALHPYDYTGRPQGVKKEDNPDYYKLLQEYKSITGESLILNTSYNLHGFPMVQDQEQSIHVLLNSGLEYLALGNYLLSKT